MYASEILLDVLDAIDITPDDLPKIPLITIPHPKIIFKNRSALMVLSVGLLGFTVYYLLATNKNGRKEKRKTHSQGEGSK